MKPLILSSSILSADFSRLGDQIRLAEDGGVDWLHIDVMDGSFVPNISMGPFIVETCRRLTSLPLDVHLMIDHPERHIEAFAGAGASILTIHSENNPNVYRTLQAIRTLGCTPALAVNPGTSAYSIDALLDQVDMLLVMSVNPGFSGQVFIPESLKKIAALRKRLDEVGQNARLQVDGGITSKNINEIVQAGADTIVAATAIFKHPQGIHAGIRELRSSVR